MAELFKSGFRLILKTNAISHCGKVTHFVWTSCEKKGTEMILLSKLTLKTP